MCGKNGILIKVLIESSEMQVCAGCAKFGKIITEKRFSRPAFKKKGFQKNSRKENLDVVIANYGVLVKNAREKLQLTQEQLAKRLTEKESILQKLESESFKPSLKLARKLERFLKIKLVENLGDEPKADFKTQTHSAGFTLGDFIKKKN